MEFMIILLSNLLVTVLAYLLVPGILCIKGKKYKKSTIKKIVIINGAVVWLLFQIIRIQLGNEGTSAAVILWSSVAYWLMKKRCLVNVEEVNLIEDITDSNEQENIESLENSLEQKHSEITQEKKHKVFSTKWIFILLVVVLIGSIGYNIHQHNKIKEEQHKEKTEEKDDEEDSKNETDNLTNPNNVISYDVSKVIIKAESAAGVGDVFSEMNSHLDYLIYDNQIGQVYDVNYKVVGGISVTHAETDEDNQMVWVYGPVKDWWYNVTLSDGTSGFIWGGENGMYIEEQP